MSVMLNLKTNSLVLTDMTTWETPGGINMKRKLLARMYKLCTERWSRFTFNSMLIFEGRYSKDCIYLVSSLGAFSLLELAYLWKWTSFWTKSWQLFTFYIARNYWLFLAGNYKLHFYIFFTFSNTINLEEIWSTFEIVLYTLNGA